MQSDSAAPDLLLHPLTWLSWAFSVLAVLTLTRNPWYLLLILGGLALVAWWVPKPPDAPPIPFPAWRFGLVVIPISALFNALSVHIGVTVMFQIPRAIPLLGGPVTVEALLYGALNGLALTAIYALFTLFVSVLPLSALVRLVPRAFYPVAVVITIAIGFVPTTLRHLQQIREAQAVRGHTLRGWRDWLPLFLPLLTGGLERALHLAEAMTARGFAAESAGPPPWLLRLGLSLGLLAFLGGWLWRLFGEQETIGLLLLLMGLAVIVGLLWSVGRARQHTVYRPSPWRPIDALIILASVGLGLAFLVPWPNFDRSSIFYYPYPRLIWPTLDAVLLLMLGGVLSPALAYRQGFRRSTS